MLRVSTSQYPPLKPFDCLYLLNLEIFTKLIIKTSKSIRQIKRLIVYGVDILPLIFLDKKGILIGVKCLLFLTLNYSF